MRRLLLSLSTLLLAASAAVAAPRSAADRIACEDVKAIDVYFWPHGHGVIPGFSTSAFPAAHVEIYRAKVTTNAGFLGFTSPTQTSLAKGCRMVGDEPQVRWGGGKRSIVAAKARVRCTFKRTIELKTSPLASGDGVRLQVSVGHTATGVVDLAIRATGSQLTYSKRYCKRIALLPGS